MAAQGVRGSRNRMMNPEQAVVASILLCIAGAVLTLLLGRRRTLAGWIAFAVTAGTAVLIAGAVTRVLTAGPSPEPARFWEAAQWGFALRLHVDGLTAVFLLLAALVAVPAALYSVTYLRHYEEYSAARYYPHFLLFLAAMYGIVSTTDMMWFFFVFWQLMTLPGYALIRFEHRRAEHIRAANKYLVMMQIGCAATMAGAWILASGGSPAGGAAVLKFDFSTVSATMPLMLASRPGATAAAFTLILIGFGIKMGMWPFGQVWLPDAHPAAPSPVSAMLSGVMIKTGVYGLLRYFLWLVPPAGRADFPLARWGLVVSVLGTITLFTGTMQALRQEQSKRLLAFHSIGQIGYILLGTGGCMALLPAAGPAAAALAALALFGALLHVLNHGLFKALLFLNAGSMLHATGTQDLNRMGGLIKFMPLTALTALVASFSISGVPLFNGFVSKWSIYAAAILGGSHARYLPVCAVIAIFTSALTLASFIKFFGVSFLSRESRLVAARVAGRGRLEVGWAMQLPQVFFALCCVALGTLPAVAFQLVQRALDASREGYGAILADAAPVAGGPAWGLDAIGSAARFAPLVLATFFALLLLAAWGVARLGNAPRRADSPWLCGYAREAECHRYAAHHFYREIERYFGWLGGRPHPPPATKKH
jgi:formate hydrogenlyase subunit 3/multisubunit Na+/H+ antiporter MnhD subunit